MKHSPTRLVTTVSARTLSRGVRKNARFKTTHIPKPTQRPGGLIDRCYRALLESSSNAVLLLSPESIILEWNGIERPKRPPAGQPIKPWVAAMWNYVFR